MKLRVRLKHGAREELLALLKLKNIGRIRARKLYNNKIRDISELKKADLSLLVHLIGEKTALDVKKQVGEEVDEGKIRVKENRKKGQLSLNDYKG
jgi:helicase